jgi:hypothetical protein
VDRAAHLQLINRYRPNRGPYRRDLRRLPQELRQDRQLCSLLILILLLSARQIRRPKSRLGCRLSAGVAQWAERHGCRESRPPPWMADGGGPTERRRSEGTRGTRAQPGAKTLGYLVSFQVTRRRRNRSGVSQNPTSRTAIRWSIQISSCTRNAVGAAGAVRQPRSGISVNNVLADPPPRCRRDLRRLPQEMRQDGQLCSLLILILLLCARQFGRHKSRLGCRLSAGVAQWAERHGCRESRPPPWMADGGGPTERRRSEGTGRRRAKPGARTLGYLVSFQVTRRRRNRSGVSQNPTSRAAITWRIQISIFTRNAVGAAGAVRQPRSGISVNNVLADPPPRCRRDLRRLPQEMRQDGQLCSLLILILLLCARQFGRHKSRLGCRLSAGVAQWVERHGCRESRPPPWMADGGGPTERRRSEGTTTKESPNQEPGHLVTWCPFK